MTGALAKLIIVEDEDIIREGINDRVAWAELGVEVVGLAEDGEKALSLLETHRPDIVITDIRVPFIDGLQLAEIIAQDYPGTSVVIISGYDDFGYAQKALKLGVEDYILKPLDLDYLADLIRKLCQKRGRLETEVLEIRELRELATKSDRTRLKRSLLDLASGRLADAEIERLQPETGNPATWYGVACIILDAASDAADYGRAAGRQLYEAMDRPEERSSFFMEDGEAEYLLICSALSREGLLRSMDEVVLHATRQMQAFSSVSVTIGVGGAHQGPSGLALSYREAKKAGAFRYILGSNRRIDFAEAERLTGAGSSEKLFFESELVWAVKLGNREALRSNLDQLLREISLAGERAAAHLQMHVASIFMNCLESVLEEGGTVEELFEDPIAVYNAILARPTAREVLESLATALEVISSYLETGGKGDKSYSPEKAKRYIRRHYGRFDLSLDEVAEYVRLSPSYFSSIFSKYEGTSFVDYLSRVRLDKAKDLLLHSSYKTNEVADMVGFASPAYFSSIFRRYEGCTPSEFRKRPQQEPRE
jgi:two-component system response regulator YesN